MGRLFRGMRPPRSGSDARDFLRTACAAFAMLLAFPDLRPLLAHEIRNGVRRDGVSDFIGMMIGRMHPEIAIPLSVEGRKQVEHRDAKILRFALHECMDLGEG